VLELRFAQPIEQAAVERAARRVRREYSFEDPENAVNLQFDAATQQANVQTAWSGIKLSSVDRTDITVFRTNAFVCSRLAPYPSWEAFQPRAARDWNNLKKTTGSIGLARIGLRYINRIDVLVRPNALIRVEDFLNVFPRSPDELGESMTGYTMQIVRPLGTDNCSLVLNSGTVPSPLIGFASFALDLDVYREQNLPRRDDELWALIENIRHHKNRIFESCITDRARALFDQ
jgi:uncharacterized protein (TIGR04255 family)